MKLKDRRTWQLWNSLEKGEKAHFLRWLDAELGEKQRYLRQLAHLFPSFSPPPETLHPIWKALYPNRPFHDGRMRKLLHALSGHLETYLAIQAFRQAPEKHSPYLLEALLNRKQPELFEKTYNRITLQQEEEMEQNPAYYHRSYSLLSRRQRFLSQYHPRSSQFDWAQYVQVYDAWWMQERLALAFQGLLLQDRGSESLSWLDEDALFDLIKKRKFDMELPLLNLYVDAYELLTQSPSDEKAYQLLEKIRTLHQQGAGQALPNLYILLVNYYSLQLISREEEVIARILLRLYLTGIELGWMLVNGTLSWNRLRNIINLALRISNFVEVEELLEDLLEFLPKEDREEARHFHQTTLLFSRGAYKKVLTTLRTHRYSNAQYEIQARAQLIMSGYELAKEDTEWLLNQIAALRRYILQKSAHQGFSVSYLNQLRILGRLLKAHSRPALKELLIQIEETQPLSKAKWLRQKVQERLQRK